MQTHEEIEMRREAILKEIAAIRFMARGTINEQLLKVRRKGQGEPVLRGPYYVLSRREGNKTVSRRLTTAAELKQAREDIKAHKRFRELCREYEELTERLGDMIRSIGKGEKKKRPKSPSKKRPR